jgi:hypothetical protein
LRSALSVCCRVLQARAGGGGWGGSAACCCSRRYLHLLRALFVYLVYRPSWQMEDILGGQSYYGLNATEQAAYAGCTTDYSSCTPRFKAVMDSWAVSFGGKLAPALANQKDGLFVNNCHRHHNIDGAEAFTTKINGTSLVEAVRKRESAEPNKRATGPGQNLIQPYDSVSFILCACCRLQGCALGNRWGHAQAGGQHGAWAESNLFDALKFCESFCGTNRPFVFLWRTNLP